jgi:hypothetical protein
MHYIEAKLGRPIERISPEDTDEMERVRASSPSLIALYTHSTIDTSLRFEGKRTSCWVGRAVFAPAVIIESIPLPIAAA